MSESNISPGGTVNNHVTPREIAEIRRDSPREFGEQLVSPTGLVHEGMSADTLRLSPSFTERHSQRSESASKTNSL